MPRSQRFLPKSRKARSLIAFLGFSGFVILLFGFLFLIHFERKAFDYDIEALRRIPKETVILDATQTAIGYLNPAEGGNLPLNEISRHFIDALIAREDSRFWKHHGVDHIGLLRANFRNLREGRYIQGASTITMQLSRMTYELRERNYERKLVEMAIARRIERHYSKEEILGLYANRVFLGTGMHGIGEAAEGYFGKKPSQLNLAESAMLAGIIRAPNRFSPFRSPNSARLEMLATLQRMGLEGKVTRQEADNAKATLVRILPQERWMSILAENRRVHQKDWVINMVEKELHLRVPGSEGYGGFTIQTTIDHRLNTSVKENLHKWISGVERARGYSHPRYPAVNEKGEPVYLQGAGVMIDNQNGAIRSLVGGRDYLQSGFNRAIHDNRQAGSIVKPLIYATAFETGMFPGMYVSDEKILPGEFRWWGNNIWSPLNADHVHQGQKPASIGLIQSRNTMTVRVGEWAGIANVYRMLSHAGISVKGRDRDPQVYIGNLPVSLLSMVSAYTAFPMEGIRHKPFLIETIYDPAGKLIFRHQPEQYQLFSPEAAWMTSAILQKVLEQGGSGANLRKWGFTAPAGGKTGTTDDFVDAWFVGYTSRLTSGFWVGLDQPAPVLPGAYGGAIAMPVWKDTMLEAQQIGYEFTEFTKPTEIFKVRICRGSGLLASPTCESRSSAYTEELPSSMIPRKFCDQENDTAKK